MLIKKNKAQTTPTYPKPTSTSHQKWQPCLQPLQTSSVTTAALPSAPTKTSSSITLLHNPIIYLTNPCTPPCSEQPPSPICQDTPTTTILTSQ